MLIDWFTVGAQALNFLVLVWLLKRFLYKPILNALDARENRIAGELADADAKKVEAENERKAFQQKNEEFDRERDALLSDAKEDAKTERRRLIEDARQAADDLSGKHQESLRREQQSLSGEIARRTREEVFAIAGKALKDLAGIGLEERMSEVFVHRLRALDAEAKEGLARALKALSGPALVRSAFDLPPVQKAAIQQAIKETFAGEMEIRFETAPAVISGVEISANGRKVAWSIADYLASLERSVGELLDEQSPSQAGDKADDGPSGLTASPPDAQSTRETSGTSNPEARAERGSTGDPGPTDDPQ